MSTMEETKIIYHMDDEETPYLVKLNISPERVTLADFKNVLNRPNYKYFFKSMDDDFGWAYTPIHAMFRSNAASPFQPLFSRAKYRMPDAGLRCCRTLRFAFVVAPVERLWFGRESFAYRRLFTTCDICVVYIVRIICQYNRDAASAFENHSCICNWYARPSFFCYWSPAWAYCLDRLSLFRVIRDHSLGTVPIESSCRIPRERGRLIKFSNTPKFWHVFRIKRHICKLQKQL